MNELAMNTVHDVQPYLEWLLKNTSPDELIKVYVHNAEPESLWRYVFRLEGNGWNEEWYFDWEWLQQKHGSNTGAIKAYFVNAVDEILGLIELGSAAQEVVGDD